MNNSDSSKALKQRPQGLLETETEPYLKTDTEKSWFQESSTASIIKCFVLFWLLLLSKSRFYIDILYSL